LPAGQEDRLEFPDFIFWLAESLIVTEPGLAPRLVCTAFGAEEGEDRVRAHYGAAQRLAALAERCEAPLAPIPAPALRPGPEPATDLDDEAYAEVVRRMKEHILAGDIYQVVPSRTFSAPCADPLAAFAAL